MSVKIEVKFDEVTEDFNKKLDELGLDLNKDENILRGTYSELKNVYNELEEKNSLKEEREKIKEKLNDYTSCFD